MERFLHWVAEQCRDLWGKRPLAIEPLASDGSERRFFRVRLQERSIIALWNPDHPSENDSYWEIGHHLRDRGVPVPELYVYERQMGWILVQDLGRVSLQEAVRQEASPQGLLGLYSPVIRALLVLQTKGREGFKESWCYQTPRYDENLMLVRESGYFMEAFLKGYAAWRGPEGTLLGEFSLLANMAARLAPAQFLIHRDFQSRNILVAEGGSPGIIDFQGARLGPLQYDVASLLMDPYVSLPRDVRDSILREYLLGLLEYAPVSPEAFLEGYPLVALHRNLQILAAFAFLGKTRGKSFFLRWIPGALSHLQELLRAHPQWPCPLLRDTVAELCS
jgi:aminoglycoside/choline kinase family phosphotransferase